ncbi:MAG TPA: CRISPR-associated endoribonuclease Cas6 [Mycobacteriales bacterium]
MRLRIELTTRATVIPWDDVLRPGRGVIYHLLGRSAPMVAGRLHEQGWGPHRMVPFGYGAPVFPRARTRRGRYAAGGPGTWELGSPLPGMVDTWVEALSGQDILSWSGIPLRIRGLVPMAPPSFASGRAEFRTSTPVVTRAPVLTRGGEGVRRSADLLPYEDGFIAAFTHNLRHKAETLGMEPNITVERVTWVGAKRSFAVKDGRQVGAPLGVELRGSPALLRALWCWGLGHANSAGFGWITA